MNNILCSIIIPYYNVPAELVNKCLSSILNQNWENNLYEVIFINDGSPTPVADSTKSLFKEFPHFTYIQQENKGLSAARNIGIKSANGSYLFFLDSDDYWFDNSIDKLLPYLKIEKYDIVKFLSQHIYNTTPQRSKFDSEKIIEFYSGCEYMSKNNIVKGACTYCFRNLFLKTYNIFMPKDIIHEDEYFLTQAFFFAQDVLITNILLYAYIKRDGSITSRKTHQQWLRSFNDFFETLKLTANYKSCIENTFVQEIALNNRMSFLICDYIFNVFNSPIPKAKKLSALNQLKEIGFYPLPTLTNNFKYKFLRLFSRKYSTILIWTKVFNFMHKLKSKNQNY